MQKAIFEGVKFCPACGCNIHVINRALQLSMPAAPAMQELDEPELFAPRSIENRPAVGLQPKPKPKYRSPGYVHPNSGKPRPAPIPEEKKVQARRLRAEGMKLTDIARITAINESSLAKIVRNVPRQTNGVSHGE